MQSRTALHETSEDGAFKRKDSTYRSWIGKEFPAEGTLAWCAGSASLDRRSMFNRRSPLITILTFKLCCSWTLPPLHLLCGDLLSQSAFVEFLQCSDWRIQGYSALYYTCLVQSSVEWLSVWCCSAHGHAGA